jgi:hypothetical protein
MLHGNLKKQTIFYYLFYILKNKYYSLRLFIGVQSVRIWEHE